MSDWTFPIFVSCSMSLEDQRHPRRQPARHQGIQTFTNSSPQSTYIIFPDKGTNTTDPAQKLKQPNTNKDSSSLMPATVHFSRSSLKPPPSSRFSKIIIATLIAFTPMCLSESSRLMRVRDEPGRGPEPASAG